MSETGNGNILVVDDTPQTLQLLVAILSGANYTVRPADSGALALASALAYPPELVLLDVNMPEMSGFEVCRQLKQNPATQAIPVVFLSGLTDLDDRVQGFQLGAVDFVAKPFQRDELLARVSTHLQLARLQKDLTSEVAKQTRDLQGAYQELAKASRLKDEFLSTMSHELRTPLTAVIGMAQILHAGAYGPLNREQAEAIEVVEGSGRKLLQMINDILDYIQVDAGKVELQLARLQKDLTSEVAKQTRDLQGAYQELAKASRLKDEFLSTMSHELRTPLTAVIGMAEILHSGGYGKLNKDQAEALEVIEGSGRKLLHLINDILDYIQVDAGKEQLQLEQCPVVELVNAVLENVRSKAAEKHIELSCRFYQQESLLWLDVRHMRRVLLILLDNAVKFTSSGGNVGIIVRNSIVQHRIEFEVWDGGPGIAEADLPKLFKPFLQLDGGLNRSHEGSGLGLALAGKLARLLGGEIRVTSQLNAGSRFIVSLPLARGEHE